MYRVLLPYKPQSVELSNRHEYYLHKYYSLNDYIRISFPDHRLQKKFVHGYLSLGQGTGPVKSMEFCYLAEQIFGTLANGASNKQPFIGVNQ